MFCKSFESKSDTVYCFITTLLLLLMWYIGFRYILVYVLYVGYMCLYSVYGWTTLTCVMRYLVIRSESLPLSLDKIISNISPFNFSITTKIRSGVSNILSKLTTPENHIEKKNSNISLTENNFAWSLKKTHVKYKYTGNVQGWLLEAGYYGTNTKLQTKWNKIVKLYRSKSVKIF